MPKQPTSVSLDRDTREKIERAREKLSHGKHIKPSLGEVVRGALALGLPLLTAPRDEERAHDSCPPPRSA